MSEKMSQEFAPEQHDEENRLLKDLETDLEKIKGINPEIYEKFDIESLKHMQGFPDNEKIEHIKSIKDEIINILSDERKNEFKKLEKSGKTADWKLAAISLIALINSFSVEPAVAQLEKPAYFAQRQEKSKKFISIKELLIDGKKFKFGISTDDHGNNGIFEKYAVLDEKGNNIFPGTESTWYHGVEGYYIGNLKGDKNPEILCWHSDVSGLEQSNKVATFYQYNQYKNKYEPYWKDYTDESFSSNEKNKIVKTLLGIKSKYEKAYDIARKYNNEISILSGNKPDNRAMMYVFLPPDKNPANDVTVFFDRSGKIYVKPGSEGPGRIDIEKYLYK